MARLRTAALMSAGAVALHQLRYLVANGGHAGEALARDGHGGLNAALPVLGGVTLALVLLTLAWVAVSRAAPSTSSRDRGRTALYALVLLVAFGTQELIEGAFVSGHPAGLTALAHDGGIVVLPLALLLGKLISLLTGALVAADRAAACTFAPRRARSSPSLERLSHTASPVAVPIGLVRGFAQRAPPLLAIVR
jgi:hypothetical protein